MARNGVWTGELGLIALVERDRVGFPFDSVPLSANEKIASCAYYLDTRVLSPAAPAKAPLLRRIIEPSRMRIGDPLSPEKNGLRGTWGYFHAWNGRMFALSARSLSPELGPVFLGKKALGAPVELPQSNAIHFELDPESVVLATADHRPIAGHARCTSDDLRRGGIVYLPAQRRAVLTQIIAFGVTARLWDRSGAPSVASSLIMTRACASANDTGTCLLSQDGFALGVLAFARPDFSFFLSTHELVTQLEKTLPKGVAK